MNMVLLTTLVSVVYKRQRVENRRLGWVGKPDSDKGIAKS